MARISPGTMTALVFAILLGLGGAFAVRQYLHQPQVAEAEQPPAQRMVTVPVAADHIVAGRPLTLNDIVVHRMTREKFAKSAFANSTFMSSTNQIVGRVLKEPVEKGGTFEPTQFYPDGMGPNIASSLQPGYRAVSVPIQNIGVVAGFAGPGAFVDVLFRAAPSEGYPEMTMTLVEGVTVLAVEDKTVDGYHGRGAGNVTLAMTPTQAKALKVVEGRGELSLTLRNPIEAEGEFVSATNGQLIDDKLTLNQLLGRKFVVATRRLEIYNGGQRSTREFREAVPTEERFPQLIETPIAADPTPHLALPAAIEAVKLDR